MSDEKHRPNVYGENHDPADDNPEPDIREDETKHVRSDGETLDEPDEKHASATGSKPPEAKETGT